MSLIFNTTHRSNELQSKTLPQKREREESGDTRSPDRKRRTPDRHYSKESSSEKKKSPLPKYVLFLFSFPSFSLLIFVLLDENENHYQEETELHQNYLLV